MYHAVRLFKYLTEAFMKAAFLFFTAVIFISSCKNNKKIDDPTIQLKVEMLETDRAFSAMSKSKGLRNAFMNFIDNDAVLLRPNSTPLEGGEAMDLIISSNDTLSTLTWEPKNAAISKSGDLGYTYGVYSRKPGDMDTVYYGTYVTIWKRQPDGKWKFVLQSGNEGVE
jgi:ketosteroid isomerase-like protein